MGEAVLRDLLAHTDLGERVVVDSLGTGPWEVGRPADPRAIRALRSRGYDAAAHVARQVARSMLASYDLVLAMDSGHLRELQKLARTAEIDTDIRLMRSFDPSGDPDDLDVEDPYYDQDAAFETVLDQVETSCREIVAFLQAEVTR